MSRLNVDELSPTDSSVVVLVKDLLKKGEDILAEKVISATPAGRDLSEQQTDEINFLDYLLFSDGSDCSLALKRILNSFSGNDAICIKFPVGYFRFLTPMSWSGNAAVYMKGDQGTVLSLEAATNNANISITSVRRVAMQDIEISVTPNSASGAKVGIYLNCTGQDVSHSLINVRGTTSIEKSDSAVIFFDIVNPSLSNFSSCYVRYFGDLAKTEFSNNIAFRVTATTKVSTDSRFENCSVVGCEYPYLVSPPNATSGFLEGIAWDNCTVVDCLYGPAVRGDSSKPYKSPMYRWIGGHIFAYKTCLDFYWVSQIIIDAAILYMVYDSNRSGSQGRAAITLNETVTTLIGDVIVRLVDQPNDGNSEGVYVGTNCSYTKIASLVAYTSSQGKGVLSVPASKYTRAFDVCVIYAGTAPSAAVALGGTNDVNLGGTSVYPA